MKKKVLNFLKSKKAFTLVELSCALGISVIVVIVIYSMMMAAQQSFVRLYNSSKNNNNVRALINHLRNSMAGATSVTINNTKSGTDMPGFTFISYVRDGSDLKQLTEKFYFTENGSFGQNSNYAETFIKPNGLESANYNQNLAVFKGTRKVGTGTEEQIFYSTDLKNIYYSTVRNADINSGEALRLNLGVIYQDIMDNGRGEPVARVKRKNLCFTSKR